MRKPNLVLGLSWRVLPDLAHFQEEPTESSVYRQQLTFGLTFAQSPRQAGGDGHRICYQATGRLHHKYRVRPPHTPLFLLGLFIRFPA